MDLAANGEVAEVEVMQHLPLKCQDKQQQDCKLRVNVDARRLGRLCLLCVFPFSILVLAYVLTEHATMNGSSTVLGRKRRR